MDDYKQRIIDLVNGAQDEEKLELILRFIKRLLGQGGMNMEVNRNDEIPGYRREILRLLRLLWKQQDFNMWQQIYTVIHCFCDMKGVM